jgi:hypothetical protein
MDLMVPLHLAQTDQILHMLMNPCEAARIRLLRYLHEAIVYPGSDALQASGECDCVPKPISLMVEHSFPVFMVPVQTELSREILEVNAHMCKRELAVGNTERRLFRI